MYALIVKALRLHCDHRMSNDKAQNPIYGFGIDLKFGFWHLAFH